MSPPIQIFRGFFAGGNMQISDPYTVFPRFFIKVGDFLAQHFIQLTIHRRIFNELNNFLFNREEVILSSLTILEAHPGILGAYQGAIDDTYILFSRKISSAFAGLKTLRTTDAKTRQEC